MNEMNEMMEQFAGMFWTDDREMFEYIAEVAGQYDLYIGFCNDEYATIEDEDGQVEMTLYFGQAGRTMWVQRAESKTLWM